MTKITESGVIGGDGKLRMPMDRVRQFCAKNKTARVVVTIEAWMDQTELQQGYYYNYIVPAIVAGFSDLGEYMSEAAADYRLVRDCPIDFTFAGKTPEFGRELSCRQMAEFIGWIKQYAAENLGVYVEDPRSL